MTNDSETIYQTSESSSFLLDPTATMSPLLLVVSVSSALIITTFVAAFVKSHMLMKTLQYKDVRYFLPVAYLFSMTQCIMGILFVVLAGIGKPSWAITVEKIAIGNKLRVAESYIYFAPVTFSKLAVLALYLRIFHQKPYRISIYFVAVLVILTWLAHIVTASLSCRPFEANWNIEIKNFRCLSQIWTCRMYTIPNIISGVIMFILPIPAVHRLQVDGSTKFSLYLAFSMGSIGIIGTILRALETHFVDTTSDFPTMMARKQLWTLVEITAYMVAACIPSLRPLRRKLFPQFSISGLLFAQWTGLKNTFMFLNSWTRSRRYSDMSHILKKVISKDEVHDMEEGNAVEMVPVHVPNDPLRNS